MSAGTVFGTVPWSEVAEEDQDGFLEFRFYDQLRYLGGLKDPSCPPGRRGALTAHATYYAALAVEELVAGVLRISGERKGASAEGES